MPPVESVEVEVLVDGTWHFGVLRDWQRRDDSWYAAVSWHRGPGDNLLDVFEVDRVRQVLYCPWRDGHWECLGWPDCRAAPNVRETPLAGPA